MANRWGKSRNSDRLYIFGSKITADMKLKDACSLEKNYDKPRQHIENQITLPTKVHLVKTTVFPVIVYGCKSWTINKAVCQGIDAFELCCWRRLWRVPWTAMRSNQSILKEINPEYSLEGLMLKLKLQYFGHLIQKADSHKKPWCGERLKTAGERDNRGWDGWMASLTQWTRVWVGSRRWWRTGGGLVCCSLQGQKESDMTEQLNNSKRQKQLHTNSILYLENLFFTGIWVNNSETMCILGLSK